MPDGRVRLNKNAGPKVPYRGGYLQLQLNYNTLYVVDCNEAGEPYGGGFILSLTPNGEIHLEQGLRVPFIKMDDDKDTIKRVGNR